MDYSKQIDDEIERLKKEIVTHDDYSHKYRAVLVEQLELLQEKRKMFGNHIYATNINIGGYIISK